MDRIKAMNVAELRFEDARQRTWFGSSDRKQAKYGAGFREGLRQAELEGAEQVIFRVESHIMDQKND